MSPMGNSLYNNPNTSKYYLLCTRDPTVHQGLHLLPGRFPKRQHPSGTRKAGPRTAQNRIRDDLLDGKSAAGLHFVSSRMVRQRRPGVLFQDTAGGGRQRGGLQVPWETTVSRGAQPIRSSGSSAKWISNLNVGGGTRLTSPTWTPDGPQWPDWPLWPGLTRPDLMPLVPPPTIYLKHIPPPFDLK